MNYEKLSQDEQIAKLQVTALEALQAYSQYNC